MGTKLNIATGMKFNRLTIVSEISKIKERRAFECVCDCGKTVHIILKELTNGHTKSCGCYKIDNHTLRFTKHGGRGTKLYNVWKGMRMRCNNSNTEHFMAYGGRGITICKDWDEFLTFKTWSIKNGYAEGLSIDRINVNGNYEPDNCRWSTQLIQVRNARSNNKITFNNKTQCLSEWAEELGIKRSTLSSRINTMGWSIDRALTAAV